MQKIPVLNCKYGSPFGRESRYSGETEPKLELQRVMLDADGYDSGGAYWGRSSNLWRYASKSGEDTDYLRADSRQQAEQAILERFPDATIINANPDCHTPLDSDEFTQGYIEAAFFTEAGTADDAENDLEDADPSEVAESAMIKVIADCTAFQAKVADLLKRAYARNYTAEQAGRDYWFSRNGHGVGYCDREELDDAKAIWRALGSPRVDEPGWKEYQKRTGKGQTLGDKLHAACKNLEVSMYRGDDGKIYFD